MNEKVTGSSCMDCIHNSVCSYKQDFLDICSAVAESKVVKQLGSQGMSSKKVALYDVLDEIVIKCKYYRKDVPTPRYQDSITTLTNPYDISTSTSTSTPRSSLETTTDYIFG